VAKREILERDLRCACGATGKARWIENENPAHANWQIGADVPDVSGPFDAIDKTPGEDATFRCTECGKVAELGRVTLVR